ncbi:MAG: IS66 family transposase zinc-finger binding domain-containing protein [Deltaproteobacteria bacterium]|nr:IS66 family transposase zinc-finger binding domain-containing protein [Deltaproteobacteria bacterium]
MSDSQRPCPNCGIERRCTGHDVSEVLELVPARVIVRRDLREKLACDACDAPYFSRAPVGDRVVQGGQYGPRFVAQLLVDKYRDGLPLHRQRERYRRLGVDARGSGCVRRRAPTAAVACNPDRGTQS